MDAKSNNARKFNLHKLAIAGLLVLAFIFSAIGINNQPSEYAAPLQTIAAYDNNVVLADKGGTPHAQATEADHCTDGGDDSCTDGNPSDSDNNNNDDNNSQGPNRPQPPSSGAATHANCDNNGFDCGSSATSVPQPTATRRPPTQVVPTNTRVVPTNTRVVPTNTRVVPTNTRVVPTNTQVVPTNTRVVPTNTRVVPTNTPMVPSTLVPQVKDKATPPANTCTTPAGDYLILVNPSSKEFKIVKVDVTTGSMGVYRKWTIVFQGEMGNDIDATNLCTIAASAEKDGEKSDLYWVAGSNLIQASNTFATAEDYPKIGPNGTLTGTAQIGNDDPFIAVVNQDKSVSALEFQAFSQEFASDGTLLYSKDPKGFITVEGDTSAYVSMDTEMSPDSENAVIETESGAHGIANLSTLAWTTLDKGQCSAWSFRPMGDYIAAVCGSYVIVYTIDGQIVNQSTELEVGTGFTDVVWVSDKSEINETSALYKAPSGNTWPYSNIHPTSNNSTVVPTWTPSSTITNSNGSISPVFGPVEIAIGILLAGLSLLIGVAFIQARTKKPVEPEEVE